MAKSLFPKKQRFYTKMQYHPPKIGTSYSAHDYEGQGQIPYSILEAEIKQDYELQQKYMENKKEDAPFSQDYARLDKEEKPKESVEKNIEEEEKIRKYGSKDAKRHAEEITKKQAEMEINKEIAKTGFENSKKEKTIEDAIKDAVKQEQSLLVSK